MTSTLDYTQANWAEQLLEDVNSEAPNEPAVPIDTNTVTDILHWLPAEEPSSDWYDRNNPLNASLGTTSTSGLGSYPDLSTGAEYTAAMIDQSNMSGIRGALAADDAVGSGFSQAVVAAPWASSHYGGNPLDIAQTGAVANTPAPASAGSPGSTPAVTLADLSGTNATEASLNASPFDLFGVPQTILGSAAASVWSEIGPFVAKAMLVVLGLGLVGLGLYKSTDVGPKLKGAAQKAAPLAEAAAA